MLRKDPDRLRALLEALEGVQRLVLLGDVVELRQGPVRDALRAAGPVLAEIGAALGAGGEVVLVPGNHDHRLLSGWAERRARVVAPPTLGLDTEVDWADGEPFGAVADALAPAEVEVRYPGLWLRDDVYVTHGHYLDRHTTVPMFERLGAGAMARIVGSAGAPERGADGYEAVLAPMYAWIHELAQHGGPQLGRSSHGASRQAWRALEGSGRRRRGVRGRAVVAAFPLLVGALGRSPLGPLHADISESGAATRRAEGVRRGGGPARSSGPTTLCSATRTARGHCPAMRTPNG